MQNAIANPNSTPGVRTNVLETLGYVCEELGNLESDHLTDDEVNAILNSVVNSIPEPDESIAATAMEALSNALLFAKSNFDRDEERNVIMSVVCNGCRHQATEVRVAAFQCLDSIADIYYEKLPGYMQALWELTGG